MLRLTGEAINFIEEWIAVELFVKAPSGETEHQVLGRLVADARAAGLSPEEIEEVLCDADIPEIVAKHADAE